MRGGTDGQRGDQEGVNMAALTPGLTLLERGDDDYEAARTSSVWNGLRPDRFPELIALVRDVSEAQSAVRLAAERGLRVTVRSGGHSWSANHLRDGALMIDLSRLTDVEVDVEREIAWVSPAVRGEQLIRELRQHDLFFTTGHCNDVGLGGFTLGGGFGWMSRVHGMACESVVALDVITADGYLVRCDSEHNKDLYWAARGAGPGFPGIVVRLALRVYPLYPVMMLSTDLYPRAVLDELFLWLETIIADVPEALELRVNVSREHPGVDGVGLRVVGSTFAADADAARHNLAILDSCPVLEQRVSSVRNAEADVLDVVMASDDFCKPGKRMVADNMWTGAPMEDLLPGIRRIADTMSHESFLMWHLMGLDPKVPPGGFYSLRDRYAACIYSVWSDASDDAALAAWPGDRMREMERYATGIQINDENLERRTAAVADESAVQRLQEICRARDPEARFHSWPECPE